MTDQAHAPLTTEEIAELRELDWDNEWDVVDTIPLLRSAVPRLLAAAEEAARLRTAVAELCDTADDDVTAAYEEVDVARAEIKRLRAVLQMAVDHETISALTFESKYHEIQTYPELIGPCWLPLAQAALAPPLPLTKKE